MVCPLRFPYSAEVRHLQLAGVQEYSRAVFAAAHADDFVSTDR